MALSTATDSPLTDEEVENLYRLLPCADSMSGVQIGGNAVKASGILTLAGSVRGLLALMRQKESDFQAREAELLALLKNEAGLIPKFQSGTGPIPQAQARLNEPD